MKKPSPANAGTKPARGRPKLETVDVRHTLSIRVTDDERMRWAHAAIKESSRTGEILTLTQWVRRVCEDASR